MNNLFNLHVYIPDAEVSAPRKQRANRKLPDVCDVLDVKCINVYQLLDELDFRDN